MKLKILIVLLSFLVSCQSGKKSFYCDEYAEIGVFRLPIIRPFELVSVNKNSGWTLSWPPEAAKTYLFNFSADSINFQKRLIICFSRAGLYNMNIVDLENEIIYRPRNRQEFIEFVKQRGVTINLYSVPELFEQWRVTKILPWNNDVSETFSCDNNEGGAEIN